MKKTILLLTTFTLVLTGCAATPTATNNLPAGTTTTKTTDTTKNPLQDKPLPSATFRTTFGMTADKTTAKVGEVVILTLSLSGASQNITTVSTNILYDAKLLKAEKIDTSSSKFPMVVKADKEKTPGIVDISMSKNTGGVSGNNIPVVTVQFRVLAPGSATFSVDGNKTSVLMEDNTNVAPLIDTLPTVHLTVQGSAKIKR